MNKLVFVGLILMVRLVLIPIKAQVGPEPPRLVVGIVVDQMRYDYLLRFRSKFGSDGFRKLMYNGYWFQNAQYNYVPTYTGPGHASIYTGTTPSRHGIIANDWFDQGEDKSVYCVEDKRYETVGSATTKVGQISPRRMVATTLGDELKIAYKGKSKVYAVALKDRSAVLPGGFAADGAFWYDAKTGNFVTSTFYSDKLPDWMEKFNQRKWSDQFLQKTWVPLLPMQDYTESLPDDNPFETLFKGLAKPIFPYNIATLHQDNGGYGMLRATPFGNTLTTLAAEAILEGAQLGTTPGVTDLLAISYSTPDIVGHLFGPSSVELEDVYLQLDLELGRFIRSVEKRVGKGRVLFFLTADHAGVEVPAYLTSLKMPGGIIDYKQLKAQINVEAKRQLGLDSLVRLIDNDQIYFHTEQMAARKVSKQQAEMLAIAIAETYPGVLYALASTDLARFEQKTGAAALVQNGFWAARSGHVALVLQSNWIDYPMQTGTTHGSSYFYDTRIPLLFYGWKVRAGQNTQACYINDIATTLSHFLKIGFPSAADGKILPLPLKR